MVSNIANKKILLVEDEVVIAMLLEDMVTALGAVAIGPAYSLRSGLALAQSTAIDGAILDVNLTDGSSSAIADFLASKQIPFILATGYGNSAHNSHAVAILQKPYLIGDVKAALTNMFQKGG